MHRQSPPKHRHDGTSPLPLGMDWSPPPRIWAGRKTVWPHDPHTGWSYCVNIPSWIVLAKSRDSNPIVKFLSRISSRIIKFVELTFPRWQFYRVLVAIQSPEGITTTRTLLRRFNYFLKLHAAVKRTFTSKSIPSTPPKGLLRIKTRPILEERRSSLEEWITKLLLDIDFSRSTAVASFLELEAAARLSFQDDGKPSSDPHMSVTPYSESSLHVPPHSSISTLQSSLVASEYGSDTAYETSEIGSPSLERGNISEIGKEDLLFCDDLTSPVDMFVKYGITNIDESLSMGQAIIENLKSFPKHNLQASEIHNNLEHSERNGSSAKASDHINDMLEFQSVADLEGRFRHFRKPSNESVGSERSSLKGSVLSNFAVFNSNGHGSLDFKSEAEVSKTIGNVGDLDYELPDNMHLVFPINQRQKMNRILTTVQRRLITAKTDMEDLISRLTQEIVVKDYLATKVKDLEVELDTTKQKGKENLEQAIFIERERMTQMQWEMEELRQKSMEIESKLNSQQAQMLDGQSIDYSSTQQKDALHQQLDSVTRKFEDLLKQHRELERKSKADIKVLVKEVRSLRNSETELKRQLSQSVVENSEAEVRLQEERERNLKTWITWKKLLNRCSILHDQLQECNISNLTNTKGDDLLEHIPSFLDLVDVVRTSDHQIGTLIAKVQHLRESVDHSASTLEIVGESDYDLINVDDDLKAMLTSILVDNGILRKQVNSLEMNKLLEKGDTESHWDVNVKDEV